MLTHVTVVPPPGAAWPEFTMPMFVPGDNGLFISKVEGLTPVAQNVVTKDYGVGDGEYFVGKHRGKRNIVLTLGMESRGIDIEAARGELYAFFYTQSSLKLRLEFDNREDVVIDGYPETHEGDRFVSDPETQISIICPRPNFIDPTEQTETGLASNDEVGSPHLTPVEYYGDQSAGFRIRILPNPTGVTELGLLVIHTGVLGAEPGEFFTQTFMHLQASGYDEPLTVDEEFWIDSRLGRKSVYILNPTTGERRNAMKGMSGVWPILHPGLNQFEIYNDGTKTNQWDIYFNYEYGGV